MKDNVRPGVPFAVDNPILDDIADHLRNFQELKSRRESECIEFFDPDLGQWFEVVVRAIDAPSDGSEDK